MSPSSSNRVPLLDLRAQYDVIRAEVETALREVCESQHFILGPHVTKLESTISSYCDAEFGVGVSSGSDALLIALMALGVGAGDEVITTPFTFFATAGAISRVGAKPVFCDIDPDTFNLSVEAVNNYIRYQCVIRESKLVNKSTGAHVKAVIPVHLFGQVCDISSMMDLAKENRLRIVEDAAQSIGAQTTHGQRAGSLGDIGCFSFFPSKNLGAFGDAGMCTTQNERLAETMRVLRSHGSSPKYFNRLIGGNFRIDALQAAVIQVKFKYLDTWSQTRANHASFYDSQLGALTNSLSIPYRPPTGRHVFNQYTIRASSRSELRKHLQTEGIGTEIYYPHPLHLQPCFKYLGYAKGDCHNAESAAASVLSLPIYPELTQTQLEHVVNSIIEFYSTERSSSGSQ